MKIRGLVVGLTVIALSCQIAVLGKPSAFQGEGVELNFLHHPDNDPGYFTISANDACWDSLGVRLDRFPGIQREVKDDLGTNKVMYTTACYMRLSIDGAEVPLEMQVIVEPPRRDGEPGMVSQRREWHVQFPPNYFEAWHTYILTLEIGCMSPNASFNYTHGFPWFLNTVLEVTGP